jgi:asparagine synthase (glutamine-hydrolysing)
LGSGAQTDTLKRGLVRVDSPRSGADSSPDLYFNPQFALGASHDQFAAVGTVRLDCRDSLCAELGVPADGPHLNDLQLLVAAWQRWGEHGFAQIDGVFAVAIWDAVEQRLLLARDAIGERPLFFREIGGGIVFGSLPLPVASAAGSPTTDLVRLAGYLIGYPQAGPRSFIEGVSRVMPGHVVAFSKNGSLVHAPWWRPKLTYNRMTIDEGVSAARAALTEAVASVLHSDAPRIAADLTGGLDSSLIVATAAEQLDEPARLVALTAVPSGPRDDPPDWFWDESGRAAETAATHGVPHEVVRVAPESPFAVLESMLPFTQAPILNACNLGWLNASYERAKIFGARTYLTGAVGNLTVTRSGPGRLGVLARSGRFLTFARELAAFRRLNGGSWGGHLAVALGSMVPDLLWNLIVPREHRRTESRRSLFLIRPDSPAARAAEADARAIGGSEESVFDERPASRLMSVWGVDEGPYYLGVLMRSGLDLRNPLGNRKLIELCLRLPPEHYFREGRGRRLGRKLLEGKAPLSVVEEQRRGYQGANWRAGFEPARSAMMDEIARMAEDPELNTLLDMGQMRAMVERWPSGNWDDWDQIEDYRFRLFRAIGAARFARFVREWSG